MIEAKIICDSVSPAGQRLTTFQLRYPRFIHAEFMTHRRFSRNASSSRAVPTAKLLEEVRSDAQRAAPVFWGKNQAGMQAAEELNNSDFWAKGQVLSPRQHAQMAWAIAAASAASHAARLLEIGTHKQIVNRLLEPFTHINVVCTATEYMNFFGQRLDAAAQPEMRALAEAMWAAYGESQPNKLEPDFWHTPFVDDEEIAGHLFRCAVKDRDYDRDHHVGLVIKTSVARCARVSYMSNDTGKRSTVEEDLALYDRLLGAQPLHASPAEHQATPDEHKDFWDVVDGNDRSREGQEDWQHESQWGNLVGWRQYRKMLAGESVAPLPNGYRFA